MQDAGVDQASWALQVRNLEGRLVQDITLHDELALRITYELLREAPRDRYELCDPRSEPQEFEALLTAGAHESAAIRLLGDQGGYMFSRGRGRVHITSVIFPGMDKDVSSEGATFARSVIKALVATLIERL